MAVGVGVLATAAVGVGVSAIAAVGVGATGGGATVTVGVGVSAIAAVGVGVSAACVGSCGASCRDGSAAEGLQSMHKQQSILGSLPGLVSLCQWKYSEKNLSPVSRTKVSTSWKGKFVAPASLAKSLMC